MKPKRPLEVKKICQLLLSDNHQNATIALQLLKGKSVLREKVKEYFLPILEASKKKTLKALPAIAEQLKSGKGTIKARLQIDTIPEIYNSIEKLYLNNQNLEVLPEWIKKLSNLKLLALSSCNLKILPEWIGELNQLNFLTIADNKISCLPNSFGNLVNLQNCYIIKNSIQSLPDSIENLSNLKVFYIKKGNNISKKEISKIKKLLPRTKIF